MEAEIARNREADREAVKAATERLKWEVIAEILHVLRGKPTREEEIAIDKWRPPVGTRTHRRPARGAPGQMPFDLRLVGSFWRPNEGLHSDMDGDLG